jgi:hypothetical protein
VPLGKVGEIDLRTFAAVTQRGIDRILRHVTARNPDQERDRTIFWLRHRQGLTASEIAAIPSIGLTTEGVESVLLRLETMITVIKNVKRKIKSVEPESAAAPNLGLTLDGGPKSNAARVLVGLGAALVLGALIAASVWFLLSR